MLFPFLQTLELVGTDPGRAGGKERTSIIFRGIFHYPSSLGAAGITPELLKLPARALLAGGS